MAPAVSLVLLLGILICCVRAQGDDISITCPSPFPVTTTEGSLKQNITCTASKTVYTSAGVCNLGKPTAIRFDMVIDGVTTTLCTAAYDCPSSATNVVSGYTFSCGCTSAGDNGTHVSHNVTVSPTLNLFGGKVTCKVKCLSDKTEPVLANHGCDKLTFVNHCGGCDNGKICDENTLKCVVVNRCGSCDSGKMCEVNSKKCAFVSPCGGCESGKLCNESSSKCIDVGPCAISKAGQNCAEKACKKPDNSMYIVVISGLGTAMALCGVALVFASVKYCNLRNSKSGSEKYTLSQTESGNTEQLNRNDIIEPSTTSTPDTDIAANTTSTNETSFSQHTAGDESTVDFQD